MSAKFQKIMLHNNANFSSLLMKKAYFAISYVTPVTSKKNFFMSISNRTKSVRKSIKGSIIKMNRFHFFVKLSSLMKRTCYNFF